MTRRARLTREDWADAALTALADEGLAGLAVEPLARRLDVTKGSFYWHFKSRDELLDAALARWEQVATDAIREGVEALADPRERLVALFRVAFSDRDALASGAVLETRRTGALLVHLAANTDVPVIRAALSRVTEKRLALIRRIYQDLGLPKEEARDRALLCYTAYVGMFHVMAARPGQRVDREAYLNHVLATLVPG